MPQASVTAGRTPEYAAKIIEWPQRPR
jgi:hypothetical protein